MPRPRRPISTKQIRARLLRDARRQLWEEQNGCCWWCGKEIDLYLDPNHPLAATIDHLIPVSVGGKDVLSNLVVAHRVCNEARGNRMPPASALKVRMRAAEH